MKATKISIRNILGIRELEIEPGNVTMVSGGNGVGKSSIIEAIRAALGGGHDATLLRKGSESGEVVIELDDGTEVRKSVTEKGSDVSLKHPKFGNVSRPQTVLNSLHDALTLNPVDLLTEKNPAQKLLEAVPIAPDMERIRAAVEVADLEIADPDEGEHALQMIGAVRKAVYDQRRDVNAVAKRLASTIEELQGSVVPGARSDEELSDEIVALESQIIGATQERDLGYRSVKEGLTTSEKYLAQKRDEAIAAAHEGFASAMNSVRDEALQRSEELREACEEICADLRPRLEAAKAERKGLEAHANTLRMIASRESELKEAQTEAAGLTAALKALQELATEAAAAIPIEGVAIEDGALQVGGIPWERVNTAERVRVAVEVAMLRAGDLGLILVDGCEQLDPPHLEALGERIKESGCAAILTMVTEGALEVKAA